MKLTRRSWKGLVGGGLGDGWMADRRASENQGPVNSLRCRDRRVNWLRGRRGEAARERVRRQREQDADGQASEPAHAAARRRVASSLRFRPPLPSVGDGTFAEDKCNHCPTVMACRCEPLNQSTLL